MKNLFIIPSLTHNSTVPSKNNEEVTSIMMEKQKGYGVECNGTMKLTRLVSSQSNLSTSSVISSSSSITLASSSSLSSNKYITPPTSTVHTPCYSLNNSKNLKNKDKIIDPPELTKVVQSLNDFVMDNNDELLDLSMDGTSDCPENQIELSILDANDEQMSMEIDSDSHASSDKDDVVTVPVKKNVEFIVIPENLKLEPIKDMSFSPLRYRGPTTESNWVILDRLMMGAYPASTNDDQHYEISRRLLNCGIRTYVCLQDEYDHMATQNQWRSGKRIRPYIYDAAEMLRTGESFSLEKDGSKTLEMLHVAIKDCSITMDKLVQDLAEDVCLRLCKNEVIYVHCWGGHGRTGTLVAIVLGMIFGLDANEALARTQHFHDLRYSPLGVQSPQTVEQRNQVRRILNEFHMTNRGKTFVDLLREKDNGINRNAPSPFTIFKMCSGKS